MLSQTSLGYSIEQLQQEKDEWGIIQEGYQGKNGYCRKNILINNTKKTFTKSNCGMFSCEHCRPHKIITTVKNIRKLAFAYNLTRFLTMTIGGNEIRSTLTRKQSYHFLENKFRELKILLKREYGYNLKYVRLARAHKDGYCHFHILIDRYIPKAWLNDAMGRIGAGYCNIKYVDPHRVSAYLSAYLENKEHEWYVPKGIHHYTMSKGLSFDKYKPKDEWIFIYTGHTSNNIVLIWRMMLWNGCHEFFDKPPPKSIFEYGYGFPSNDEIHIIKQMLRCT